MLRLRTLLAIVFCLAAFTVLLIPTVGVSAASAVTCEGNNLRITWSGLNIPVTILDGANVIVNNGAAAGDITLTGPGIWSIQILEFGDPVANYNAFCPLRGVTRVDDQNRIPDSMASLQIVYRGTDCSFDVYGYDPNTKQGTLQHRITKQAMTVAALALKPQGSGSITLYTGTDALGRAVTISFVYPDQIHIGGFFPDGSPHEFSFVNGCVDVRDGDLQLPDIDITGFCTRGQATITFRNQGADMLTTGGYNVSTPGNSGMIGGGGAPGTPISAGTLRLRSGESQTITFAATGTLIVSVTSGQGLLLNLTSNLITAQIVCSSDSPSPAVQLSVTPGCRGNSYYFAVRNEGTGMLAPLTYTLSFPTSTVEDYQGQIQLRQGEGREISYFPGKQYFKVVFDIPGIAHGEIFCWEWGL